MDYAKSVRKEIRHLEAANHPHSGPSHSHRIDTHGNPWMYAYSNEPKTCDGNGNPVHLNDISIGSLVKHLITSDAAESNAFDGSYTSKPGLTTNSRGSVQRVVRVRRAPTGPLRP